MNTQIFNFRSAASFSILLLVFLSACSTKVDDDKNISITTSNLIINISENPENGLVIGNVPISTFGVNAVTFSIIDEIPAGAINVNSASGEITVANNLLFDYETHPTILALVEIRNGDYAVNSTININVLDVNEAIYRGDVTLKTQAEVAAFALNNYTQITGFLHIGELATPNNSITDLSPLQGLTTVGNLAILENSSLTTLQGLNNLVGPILAIDIVKNESLNDISALSNITAVSVQLQIFQCNSLVNLAGLQNIVTIDGKLIISTNPSITSLEGLNGLTSIASEYRIANNPNLSNFCATQTVFTNGFAGTYLVSGNSFNPTQAELINGICSN